MQGVGFLADYAGEDDANPALRFRRVTLTQAILDLAEFYNFANTGRPGGLRIPSEETFTADYTDEFAPRRYPCGEIAVCKATNAAPSITAGRTFNITSPYGVVALADFGGTFGLGSEPILTTALRTVYKVLPI